MKSPAVVVPSFLNLNRLFRWTRLCQAGRIYVICAIACIGALTNAYGADGERGKRVLVISAGSRFGPVLSVPRRPPSKRCGDSDPAGSSFTPSPSILFVFPATVTAGCFVTI